VRCPPIRWCLRSKSSCSRRSLTCAYVLRPLTRGRCPNAQGLMHKDRSFQTKTLDTWIGCIQLDLRCAHAYHCVPVPACLQTEARRRIADRPPAIRREHLGSGRAALAGSDPLQLRPRRGPGGGGTAAPARHQRPQAPRPEEIVAQDARWQPVHAWTYGDLCVLEALWRRLGLFDVIGETVGVRLRLRRGARLVCDGGQPHLRPGLEALLPRAAAAGGRADRRHRDSLSQCVRTPFGRSVRVQAPDANLSLC
jgi:hypothetical protein